MCAAALRRRLTSGSLWTASEPSPLREVGYRQSTTSMDVMTVIGAGGGAGGVVVAAGLSKAGAAAREEYYF